MHNGERATDAPAPLIATFFTLLQAPVAADAPVGAFAARLELPLGGQARGALAVDVDGDGADELLVAIDEPGRLLLFSGLEPTLAGRRAPQAIRIPGFALGPVSLGPGPPGGDSTDATTLALASRESDELLWLALSVAAAESADRESTQADSADDDEPDAAKPAFEFELETQPLPGRPRAIAANPNTAAEFQLAVATDEPALLLVRGDRSFERIELEDLLPTCLAFAPDGARLAIGFQATRRVLLFDLEQPERAPRALEVGGIPRDLAAFDIDSDGDAELICAGGEDSIWLFGEGVAGGWQALLNPDSAMREVHAAPLPLDLSSGVLLPDRPPQLLTLYHGAQMLGWLEAIGPDGPRGARTTFAGPSPWDVALGDFDGDGVSDVAVTNPGAASLSILFGDGTALAESIDTAAIDAPNALTCADFNGDGRDDAALLSAIDDALVVLNGAPNGALEPALRRPAQPGSDSITSADLDGDGDTDIAFTSQAPGRVTIRTLINRANGEFDDGPSAEFAGLAADLEALDADGDGTAELFASDASGGRVLSFQIAGDALASIKSIDVGAGAGPLAGVRGPDGALLGLAVGLSDPGGRFGAKLLQRRADGSFNEVGMIAIPRPPEDLAVADVDGDGNVDLIVLMQGNSDNAPGGVLVALSPGDGGNWIVGAERKVGPKPFHLAAADVDGDGCAEVFASSQYAHSVRAFRASGDRARPLLDSWDLGAGRGCMGLAFADVDGDGDLDLVVAGNHSGSVSVLRAR